MNPKVIAVSLASTHTFTKPNVEAITLLAELGVQGDAHCGKKVRHRSRLDIRPLPANLRQVHMIHFELFEELETKGFVITPGLIGENITTCGIDLLGLPQGTKLRFGDSAVVKITGLRNPCRQLDDLMPGLLRAILDRDTKGNLIRKAGVMGIVVEGGVVVPGDEIAVEIPGKPHRKLGPV